MTSEVQPIWIQMTESTNNYVLTLLETSRVHSCICMSVCICVLLPVAIPSPPLTPKKGLNGTEAVLSDLWQNPSQIRKLRSFIIAGHGVPRITWECAPKSTTGSRPACLHVANYHSSFIYTWFIQLAEWFCQITQTIIYTITLMVL